MPSSRRSPTSTRPHANSKHQTARAVASVTFYISSRYPETSGTGFSQTRDVAGTPTDATVARIRAHALEAHGIEATVHVETETMVTEAGITATGAGTMDTGDRKGRTEILYGFKNGDLLMPGFVTFLFVCLFYLMNLK